jgi:hypothetical protein
MRIQEPVIRQIMIKAFPIQLHYIRVAALMFIMAVLAVLRKRFRLPAMVAGARVAVFRDLLVAGAAKRGLSAPGERLVTLIAFFLDLGVAFRQRAGRHETLEQVLRSRRTRAPHEDESCKKQQQATSSRHAFSSS